MSEVNAKVAVSGDPTDAVSAKDVFSRLKDCRDFEIKLQWERAVFLTAFLIACFAGYGSLLLSVCEHGVGRLSVGIVSIMLECISLIGVVLSLFWIMMSKGSKAWYEHYEQAISAHAKQVAVDGQEDVAGGMLFAVKGLEGQRIDSSVFSTNGGPFSVSRIVILIGQGSLLFWVLASLMPVLFSFWDFRAYLDAPKVVSVTLCLMMGVVAVLIFFAWKSGGSKYLRELAQLPIGEAESIVYYGPFVYTNSEQDVRVAATETGKSFGEMNLVLESGNEIGIYRVRFGKEEEIVKTSLKSRARDILSKRMKAQNCVEIEDGKYKYFNAYVGVVADKQFGNS